ncbi:MAG TPA: GNAT family N-acetyltransferase [Thermomicrobiales bacterium]|nr:GNAT family N-acetyltransferase [Thermomicrobiales bacterium]
MAIPPVSGPVIETLDSSNINRLRLGWWSRFGSSEVEATLAAEPGLSVWIPAEHEYLIAGAWRNRTEVTHIVELVAIRNPTELISASVDRARQLGKRLFLAIEANDRRNPAFYERCGLEPLEEVIAYERSRARTHTAPEPGTFQRVQHLDPVAGAELIAIDHDAFPWLWRNTPIEFQEYLHQHGVEIYLLRHEGEAVAYVGISMYHGWGHIDRVAVMSAAQGRGFGRQLTEFAIHRLTELGANTIGLSTQSRNFRSQALYEKLGFRRKVAGEYRIYGALLWADDTLDYVVTGFNRNE